MTQTRRSREEWISLVRECKESGLSRRAFAEQEGLSRSALEWWCKKLRREGETDNQQKSSRKRPREERVRAVPVTVIGQSDEGRLAAGIEVRFGDLQVRFPVGTEPEYVGRVVRVLGVLC